MRLECTYRKYERNFYCQTFSSFISLYLSNGTCLLLLPRFCYAEILGLALFVLWLRWSLYQSVLVLILTAVLPHAHTELLIFIRVQFDGLVSLFIRNVCMLCVARCSHEHQKTRADHIVFVSLVLVTLDFSSQLRVVFLSVCRRLMPSIEMPLLTHVHILSPSCRLQPVVFSCLVFIQCTHRVDR